MIWIEIIMAEEISDARSHCHRLSGCMGEIVRGHDDANIIHSLPVD